SPGKAGVRNKNLATRAPRKPGLARKLFARQLAEARTTTGDIDLTRLGKLVMAAYQGDGARPATNELVHVADGHGARAASFRPRACRGTAARAEAPARY